MRNNELITRDSKGFLRIVYMKSTFDGETYTIYRESGKYAGKFTKQEDIVITAGKAKRTIEEQGELQYNSNLKKYLDKGYKNVQDLFDGKCIADLTEEEILSSLPIVVTNQNGVVKPMLSKSIEKVATKTINESFYGSRKLDGLRCLIYKDSSDGVIKTSSRGGGDYNSSMKHIIEDERVIALFESNPNIILDGELYLHGCMLQDINRLCRRDKTEHDLSHEIKYYIYDYVDTDVEFEKRNTKLEELKEEFGDSEVLEFVEHYLVSGLVNIESMAKKFVSEGYEGMVLRKAKDKYKPNGRIMLKIKPYMDDEFEITGYELGFRGAQDLVFCLKTKGGSPFKATPIGSISIKENYLANMDSMIGKMATVKFFTYSKDGIPVQTTFKGVRLKEDMPNE